MAQRIDKKLVSTGRDGQPRLGVPPGHLTFDTVSSESDRVAEMIADEHARGRAYRDCAILVRANNDADAFLRALNMRGIPWTFSGNAGLYGRPEFRGHGRGSRLVLAALRRARARGAREARLTVTRAPSSHRYW